MKPFVVLALLAATAIAVFAFARERSGGPSPQPSASLERSDAGSATRVAAAERVPVEDDDPVPDAAPPAPEDRTPVHPDDGALAALNERGTAVLAQIHELEGADGFEELADDRVDELYRRASTMQTALAETLSRRLRETGQFETLTISAENPAAQLDQLFDHAYSWTKVSDGPTSDGNLIVDVLSFPRPEYPLLNELKDAADSLARRLQARRSTEEGAD